MNKLKLAIGFLILFLCSADAVNITNRFDVPITVTKLNGLTPGNMVTNVTSSSATVTGQGGNTINIEVSAASGPFATTNASNFYTAASTNTFNSLLNSFSNLTLMGSSKLNGLLPANFATNITGDSIFTFSGAGGNSYTFSANYGLVITNGSIFSVGNATNFPATLITNIASSADASITWSGQGTRVLTPSLAAFVATNGGIFSFVNATNPPAFVVTNVVADGGGGHTITGQGTRVITDSLNYGVVVTNASIFSFVNATNPPAFVVTNVVADAGGGHTITGQGTRIITDSLNYGVVVTNASIFSFVNATNPPAFVVTNLTATPAWLSFSGQGTRVMALSTNANPIPQMNSGTGTNIAYTIGSILFEDAGGNAIAQNNGNFFWDNANLRLGIGTASPAAGRFHLVFTNAQSGTAAEISDTYSSVDTSTLRGRRARGTVASPTGVLSNDTLMAISGAGYGATAFTAAKAAISIKAGQDWNDQTNGTYIVFSTTTNGTATAQENMRLDMAGNLGIGTNQPNARLHVNGSGLFEGNITISSSGTLNGLLPANFTTNITAGAGGGLTISGTAGNSYTITPIYTVMNTNGGIWSFVNATNPPAFVVTNIASSSDAAITWSGQGTRVMTPSMAAFVATNGGIFSFVNATNPPAFVVTNLVADAGGGHTITGQGTRVLTDSLNYGVVVTNASIFSFVNATNPPAFVVTNLVADAGGGHTITGQGTRVITDSLSYAIVVTNGMTANMGNATNYQAARVLYGTTYTTGLTYVVSATDAIIACVNTGQAIRVKLPGDGLNRRVTIFNTTEAGFSTVVDAGAGTNINGFTNLLMNTRYTPLDFTYTGSEWIAK